MKRFITVLEADNEGTPIALNVDCISCVVPLGEDWSAISFSGMEGVEITADENFYSLVERLNEEEE